MSDSIIKDQKNENTLTHEEQAERERNEKVCDLYRTGYYSYNKLGRMFHVSPQRIAFIIKRAGITKEEVHAE